MKKIVQLGFFLTLVLALVFVLTTGCTPGGGEEDGGDSEGIEDELEGNGDAES